MKGRAIVLSLGELTTPRSKTAHGLIRGSDRFEVVGLIDHVHAGKDAGEVLDGIHRKLPVFADLPAYLSSAAPRAEFCLIGIASPGGKLLPEWLPHLRQAIQAGMSIVNGMHQFLSDLPEFAALAEKHGVQLIDVRKPRPREELHFWSGEIHQVKSLKLAVLGTDCAVGKRTTARFLVEAARAVGHSAEMIYTGQTGWMQGSPYGFIFDSTVNDFVSGELEHAMLTCYREAEPELIVVEGQAALRNPSGPCGSEFLVSGMMDGVILVHPPAREYYKGWQHTGRKIPPLASEIELIRLYGVETLGIALNTQGLSLAQAKIWQERYQQELGLPTVLPIEEGPQALLSIIQSRLSSPSQ